MRRVRVRVRQLCEGREDALELVAQTVGDGGPARLVLRRLLRALQAREQLHVAQDVFAQLAQLTRHLCTRVLVLV